MGLMKKLQITIIILLLLLYPLTVMAAWLGPDEILKGAWGRGEKEFGFRSGDTKDQIPWNFLVLSDGKIVIEDWVNNHLKIYLPTGAFHKSILQPGSGLYGLDSDKIVSFKWNATLKKRNIGVYSLKHEQWVWIDLANSFKSVLNTEVEVFNNIFVWNEKNGHQYSPAGKLLKTYTKRPLELGVVEKERTTDGYKYTVKYPDISVPGHTKVYTIALPIGYVTKFTRDMLGNVYAIAPTPGEYSNEIVYRYDLCEDSITKMQIPDSQYNIIYIKDRPHPLGAEVGVIAEYGQPVVAPNGDIYTWKRTLDTYSILKWTWQGEPSAPQSLRAASSKTGITLTWDVPRDDADRVDEYEINRSVEVCGPFKPIATVKKDVLTYEDQEVKAGETYYYQIRAIRDKAPSGYSNKVIGKR